MKGGNVILSRIKEDCDNSVRAIEKESKKKREGILSRAQTRAEKETAEINAQTKVKLERIKASSQSRSELEIRNAVLRQRRQEIDKTVDALLDYLLTLGDSEYFEAIYRLAAQLSGKSGEVMLNQKDLNRLPADFESRLLKAGLNAKASGKPVDICGGFVLKNGNIEENMDFAAIITANRDKLEDLINQELFSQ